MSKQRPSDRVTSGLFNVLADVCATGACCYREQIDPTGIGTVIAFVQEPSFRPSEMHPVPNAHILQTSTFDQHPGVFENH